jgi:hypothetical protein
MPVQYDIGLKSTRMSSVVTAIDSGGAPGVLEICTVGYGQVLLTVTLQRPSFSQSNGIITLLGVPLGGIGSANGTPAVARIKDSAGAIHVQGLTAGTSNADIILVNPTISAGQAVTINSGTITHS